MGIDMMKVAMEGDGAVVMVLVVTVKIFMMVEHLNSK